MNRIKHFKTKMSEEIIRAYLGIEKIKQNDIQVWKDFFFRFPELEVNNSEDHDFDFNGNKSKLSTSRKKVSCC